MFRFDRSPDKASLLETAKNTIHCLATDKRSSSEVGIGQSRSLLEQFHACVLRDGQLVGTQCRLHRATQRSLSLLQDVAHTLFEWLDGLCHVSILTYLRNREYDVNILTYKEYR